MARVLVTGAAGAVGRPVCRELLARGHQVRALDRSPSAHATEVVVADIQDADALRCATEGMDAVVHLAAQPHDVGFHDLVGPNVIGLYNVLDAAKRAGAARTVVASSIQVLGRGAQGVGIARTSDTAPTNHYALTKLWAEQMSEMYARCFGMSILAVRIAWVVRNRDEAAKMSQLQRPSLYLSANDAGRFFAQAVEAPGVDFAVIYAASADGHQCYDMEAARRLIGYQPRDHWPEGLGFDLSHSGDGSEAGHGA